MCECICGESHIVAAYQMGEMTLAVERYPGCEGCALSPAMTLHFLPPSCAALWRRELGEDFPEPQTSLAGDYPEPHLFPQVGVAELVAAAKEMEAAREARGEADLLEEHDSLADLLEAVGWELMRRAHGKLKPPESS